MSLTFSLIAALADNGVIGIENRLPWHLPADLKHFKVITTGKPVIMGRKTWQSLGRPLPNRLNIVVSRQSNFTAEGAEVFSSLEAAKQRAESWVLQQQLDEIILIGGAELYKKALEKNLINTLYLTRVHISPEGDARFPLFDINLWHKVQADEFSAEDNKPAYTIECWVKSK